MEMIIYKGIKFNKVQMTWGKKTSSYFSGKQNDKTVYLHRMIYEDNFGELPNGYSVHHKDGNGLNNDLSNLEAMPRKTHFEMHREQGWLWHKTEEGMNWHRENGKRFMDVLRQNPKTVTCFHCGKEFLSSSIKKGKRYCSSGCYRIEYGKTHKRKANRK